MVLAAVLCGALLGYERHLDGYAAYMSDEERERALAGFGPSPEANTLLRRFVELLFGGGARRPPGPRRASRSGRPLPRSGAAPRIARGSSRGPGPAGAPARAAASGR